MAANEKLLLPVDYILLKVLEEKAASDPQQYAVLAALEGLAIIAGCWRGYGKFGGPTPSNTDMLPTPWWVIDTIGSGWIEHRTNAPPRQTLGETLKIEGGGQGRHPSKDEWNRWLRGLRLSSEFFQLRQTNTYTDTVVAVAQNNTVSEDIVKRAWTEHGPNIERVAQSYRTTSGSGATDT